MKIELDSKVAELESTHRFIKENYSNLGAALKSLVTKRLITTGEARAFYKALYYKDLMKGMRIK